MTNGGDDVPEETYSGPERRRTYGVELALARIEGRLDSIIASTTALTASVVDIDRRVRDVETGMAAVKTQLNEIERKEAPRVNWTAVVSAAAAVLAVLLVVGDRIYQSGVTP